MAFNYKIGTVQELIKTARSRDYIKNNPELCYLLENPYLKDDTELAIKYNEYKKGYPNAADNFTNYYFTHGSELDTETLLEWRDIIKNDDELRGSAMRTQANLDSIWSSKKNSKNNAWLKDVLDCINQPCSYMSALSDMCGSVANTSKIYSQSHARDESAITNRTAQEKNKPDEASVFKIVKDAIMGKSSEEEQPSSPSGLNLNNTTTDATSGNILSNSFFSNVAKVPKPIKDAADMLKAQMTDIFKSTAASWSTGTPVTKFNPFQLIHAEIIGDEARIAMKSKLGDCARIVEFTQNYNPYDSNQNQQVGKSYGKVTYDDNGNPKTHDLSPNGSYARSTKFLSNNNRLNPNYSGIQVVDDSNYTPNFIISGDELDPATHLLPQSRLPELFGPPQTPCEKNLVTVKCPFLHDGNDFQVHRLIAPNLEAAFEQIYAEYGPEIHKSPLSPTRKSSIAVFNRGYRPNNSLAPKGMSVHCYGAAIDFDYWHNRQDPTNSGEIEIANPWYDRFRYIMRQHGFISLGESLGFDWMHFQFALPVGGPFSTIEGYLANKGWSGQQYLDYRNTWGSHGRLALSRNVYRDLIAARGLTGVTSSPNYAKQ